MTIVYALIWFAIGLLWGVNIYSIMDLRRDRKAEQEYYENIGRMVSAEWRYLDTK